MALPAVKLKAGSSHWQGWEVEDRVGIWADHSLSYPHPFLQGSEWAQFSTSLPALGPQPCTVTWRQVPGGNPLPAPESAVAQPGTAYGQRDPPLPLLPELLARSSQEGELGLVLWTQRGPVGRLRRSLGCNYSPGVSQVISQPGPALSPVEEAEYLEARRA